MDVVWLILFVGGCCLVDVVGGGCLVDVVGGCCWWLLFWVDVVG